MSNLNIFLVLLFSAEGEKMSKIKEKNMHETKISMQQVNCNNFKLAALTLKKNYILAIAYWHKAEFLWLQRN